MKTSTAILTLLTSTVLTHFVSGQELPNTSTATKEHQWLKKFVGEWEVVSEGSAGEGQPVFKGQAVMKSTMLGDLWVVNSSNTKFPGMSVKSIQMIGYDTDKKKYVGIWADSMMNYMWRYEGSVDKSGKKIVLEAEGPSMTGDGNMAKYRDAFEFKDENTILATSEVQGPDGQWKLMMSGTATRRK